MNLLPTKLRRPLLFIAAGALIGFLYYTFFGCTTGCPIKSSPLVTTVYAAVIGYLVSIITEPSPKKKAAAQEESCSDADA